MVFRYSTLFTLRVLLIRNHDGGNEEVHDDEREDEMKRNVEEVGYVRPTPIESDLAEMLIRLDVEAREVRVLRMRRVHEQLEPQFEGLHPYHGECSCRECLEVDVPAVDVLLRSEVREEVHAQGGVDIQENKHDKEHRQSIRYHREDRSEELLQVVEAHDDTEVAQQLKSHR